MFSLLDVTGGFPWSILLKNVSEKMKQNRESTKNVPSDVQSA